MVEKQLVTYGSRRVCVCADFDVELAVDSAWKFRINIRLHSASHSFRWEIRCVVHNVNYAVDFKSALEKKK